MKMIFWMGKTISKNVKIDIQLFLQSKKKKVYERRLSWRHVRCNNQPCETQQRNQRSAAAGSRKQDSSWLIEELFQLQRWQMWRQFEKIWALIRQLLGLARGLYQWHADDKCPSQEAGHVGAARSFSKAAAAPF